MDYARAFYSNIPRQQSTILLAENGTTSSSRRTKHLDVQYFFIMYKIKKAKRRYSGLLHKTTTRNFIHKYARKDTKPAQQYKYYCAQEVLGKQN
jgi:hypothetical protein